MALLIYGSLALCVGAVLASQHSPYSLQSAVDALHRREAQLALRDEVTGEPLDEDGYWMEPSDDPQLPSFRPNRQRLNKILANYLRRDEDPEPEGPFDPYELEARKRSIFRERDALAELPSYPTTVFREREMEKAYRPDLSADFLKEIDRQANLEREEKYLEELRDLWDKYQQQENEIEQELFNEERAAAEEPNGYYEKRQGYPTVSQSEAAAMYYGPPMEERKRQMPMLPWLPASRKKRFPVAKRSPKPESMASGTDEKVAKDLQALFGAPEEKKKRSSDEPAVEKKEVKQNDTKTQEKRDASGEEHEEHSSEEHEDDEHDHEHDHDHDHEHDHEESSEEHEGDDDDKKKRSVKKRSNLEVVKEDQILPGDIGEFKAKKSIQWNKYFGMDRRKKNGRDSGVYPLSFYKNYDEDRKKKNSLNRDKLDNMDRKLKTIEDLILDQTVKYTGDHEGGIVEPDELQKLKDKVVSRLATAYSIEKMRRTLDKLKDSVGDELDPRNNEIDSEKRDDKKEKAKRVAIKKEKAEYDHSQHSLEPSAKTAQDEIENDLEELDEDKKKKKKKRVTKRFQDMYPKGLPDFEDELGAGHYAGPVGGEGYGQSLTVESNECPLLDALERRCRGVDVLSGDIYQDLLPACGAHQLCYLCGTSQTDCDFQYLLEADTLCEKQASCQTAARSALTILRGFPGPQLGPRECAKNPCLYRAMVEVGVSGL